MLLPLAGIIIYSVITDYSRITFPPFHLYTTSPPQKKEYKYKYLIFAKTGSEKLSSQPYNYEK